MCRCRYAAPGVAPGRQVAAAALDGLRGEVVTWGIVLADLALFGPPEAAAFAREQHDAAVLAYRAALTAEGSP